MGKLSILSLNSGNLDWILNGIKIKKFRGNEQLSNKYFYVNRNNNNSNFEKKESSSISLR